MRWKDEQINTAKRILGRHKRVIDALPEIEKELNRKITVNSLKHALTSRGHAPSFYLNCDIHNVFIQSAKDELARREYQYVVGVESFVNDKERNDATLKWDSHIQKNKWIVDMYKTPNFMSMLKSNYKVPGSYTEVLYGEKITKIMVCPDAHHPFVDKKAWSVFIKACKTVKPDVLVIIGDFLDCLSISRHPKKAKDEKFFANEIESGNKALDELCSIDIKRIIYIDGNHEKRFSSYINEKAPELDSLISLKEKLRLDARRIEYIPYGEFVRIGHMAFTHDVGRCGVNAARQSLQDFGDNLVFGHSHRAQVVYGGTVEGKTHVCMNVGWLGDYDAIDYRNRPTAKREWQHSFGLIYQDQDGVSYCNLVPIINGSCIVDGKLIRA